MAKSKAHDDYWAGRTTEMLAHVDRTDLDVFAELSKIYSQGALDLQKELYAFYTKYSEDNGISYQEAQKRLRGVDLSDYRTNAERYRREAENDHELLDRLNEQYAAARATRMDALALEMTWRLGKMRGEIDDTFGNYLKKTAGYIYSKAMGGHAGAINEPVLKEIALTPFNGANYSQRIWGNVDNLAKDLRKTLEIMFIRGENPRKAAQALAKRYDVARSRAETLLRTEGTAVISNATLRRYADAGLKYYRDLVHLDKRTTDICRSIHAEDKRKLISEMVIGVNAAPYHFNCRTGIVPDDEEINQEVELLDEVPDNNILFEEYLPETVNKSILQLFPFFDEGPIILRKERLEHILDGHADIGDDVAGSVRQIIKNPTYILADHKNIDSILVIGEGLENNVNVAVRLSSDDRKNSIITAMRVSDKTIRRVLRKNLKIYDKNE